MNIGKGKVMRCSRYVNVGQMDVRLNSERLEELYRFKYVGSQVGVDGGCEMDEGHIMNEGYKAYGSLKSVLSNEVFVLRSNCTNGVVCMGHMQSRNVV